MKTNWGKWLSRAAVALWGKSPSIQVIAVFAPEEVRGGWGGGAFDSVFSNKIIMLKKKVLWSGYQSAQI